MRLEGTDIDSLVELICYRGGKIHKRISAVTETNKMTSPLLPWWMVVPQTLKNTGDRTERMRKSIVAIWVGSD